MTAEIHLLDLAQAKVVDTVSKQTVVHVSPLSDPYRFKFLSTTVPLLLGYDDFELINSEKPWMQRIFPEDVPIVRKQIGNLNENDSALLRYRVLSKFGVYQLVLDRIRVNRSTRDNLLYMVGCWTLVRKGQRNEECISDAYHDFLIDRSRVSQDRLKVNQLERDTELATGENWTPDETQTGSVHWLSAGSCPQNGDLINRVSPGTRISCAGADLATKRGDHPFVDGEYLSSSRKDDPQEDFYVSRHARDPGETDFSLARQNRQYRLMLNAIGEGVLAVDPVGKITFINPAGAKLLGWNKGELKGQPLQKILNHSQAGGEYHSNHDCPVRVEFSCGEPRSAANEMFWRKDNTAFPVDYTSTPIRNEAHQLLGAVIVFNDIFEREKVAGELFEERERAQITLQSIGDAVITTDCDGHVQYLNPVAEKMTGWSKEGALNQPFESVCRLIDEVSREPIPSPVARCLTEQRTIHVNTPLLLINRDGKEFATQDSAAPLRDREDNIIGAVLVIKDNSEERRLVREINFHATHDPLTGLTNRREFELRIGRALKSSQDYGSEHVLCYLDLDRFKVVNDSCGHAAGDALLALLANMFREHIRDRDTLARLGGDEFGILMEHCPLGHGRRAVNDIRKRVQDFRFTWEGRTFSIGVSIGLVSVGSNSSSVSDMLRAADRACYAAKDGGRNRIHVFSEDDADMLKRNNELCWVSRITQALEDNNFELAFQPIIPIAQANNGKHGELLLRLRDHDGSLISPVAYMPVAERYGIAPRMDRWVVNQACKWLSDHPDYLKHLFLIHINLSSHSLSDKDFLDFVTQQFDKTHVPAEKICFELTETAAISNLTRTMQFIKALKERGARFALDDFGTGYCSFSYLKSLPVDYVKIDGSFVSDIAIDTVAAGMVKSINEIAHLMGKHTIAEYAENRAILAKLEEIGIDYAQGFAVGYPRPVVDLSC